VVCNPVLTSSFSCSCCSSHATSYEKIVPRGRIDVTSFLIGRIDVTSFLIRIIESKLLSPTSFDHKLIQKRRSSSVIIVLNMARSETSVMATQLAPDRRDSHGSARRLSIYGILEKTRVLRMPRDALMRLLPATVGTRLQKAGSNRWTSKKCLRPANLGQ